MHVKRRRPLGCSRKSSSFTTHLTSFREVSSSGTPRLCRRCDRSEASKGILPGLICFEGKRPRRAVHPPGPVRQSPPDWDRASPGHPRQCLKCFICSRSQPHQLLPLAIPPDERAAIWDGPHIVAYWDGLPAPSSGRHARGPRPWCSRSDRLCPRAGTRVETDWRQLSLGAWRKRPCPREADFSERTCCRWNFGSSRGFYTQTK